MINKLSTTSLLCALLGMTALACDKADPRSKRRSAVEPSSLAAVPGGARPTCAPAEGRPPRDQLCPPGRLVGYFPKAGSCPSPYPGDPPAGDHWRTESLFAGVGSLQGPKTRYCRYVWTGGPMASGPMPEELRKQLGPDCRVYAQSPMATRMGPHYDEAFSQGTRPLESGSPLPGGLPVQVAVVDTAPLNTSSGQAMHGPAIAALAAKLASGCVPGLPNESACRRSVVTSLGLPQTVDAGPNSSQGGYFGYQSELAEGIVAAVDRWDHGDTKLIINLAVGWEPSLGDLGQNSTPAINAVRDAVGLAHCQGALVVAASGNRPEGTCVAQPTGPGSWERQPGWDANQCQQTLGLTNAEIRLPNPANGYHPFLHAATPLDWSRGNLADFREGSNARLATLGFAGYDERNGRSYGPMTGSSVSTAAISGIAALVWSYFPTLHADELMALLYSSGTATSASASLYLGSGQAPEQRQITACGALRYACDHLTPTPFSPDACTSPALEACQPDNDVDVSAWASGFDQALAQLGPGDMRTVAGPVWTSLQCTNCGQGELVQLPPSIRNEPNISAWVLPQPEKDPCPFCQIKGNNLYLSLDPTYDGYALMGLSVSLIDATGASEQLYYDPALFSPALSSTTVQHVEDAELASVTAGGPPPMRAQVSMVFQSSTGGMITAANQIPVGP